jgi:hypothetical protein
LQKAVEATEPLSTLFVDDCSAQFYCLYERVLLQLRSAMEALVYLQGRPGRAVESHKKNVERPHGQALLAQADHRSASEASEASDRA